MSSEDVSIVRRERNRAVYDKAILEGLTPLQAGVLSSRAPEPGEGLMSLVSPSLGCLVGPGRLRDAQRAADRIADAIEQGEVIGLITDYDVDGVTSHAILYESLNRFFGVEPARIQSHIGHRIKDGYGVSERLVDRISAQARQPTLYITADCGSSDGAGVGRLSQYGDVVVTDHHLVPASGPPPAAFATVNPSRRDCQYPDSTIAGCMVAWLLMSLVRQRLIERGTLSPDLPKLSSLLDFVALGTVADCVSIASPANRAVVKAGLQLMNRMSRPCWQVLAVRLGKERAGFDASDLAFQIGPRINARSRMADPYAALHFVSAGNRPEAEELLDVLDRDNAERRATERRMVEAALDEARAQVERGHAGLGIYLPQGHAGVQGIVASRLVERFGRPVMIFSDAAESGHLVGSGRSVEAVHLREALARVDTCLPGALLKFGGHRAAVGATLEKSAFDAFVQAFNESVAGQAPAASMRPTIWSDGALKPHQLSLAAVGELQALEPFGRQFEAPVFDGVFTVSQSRMVGRPAIHNALVLETGGRRYRCIWFRCVDDEDQPPPVGEGDRVRAAYALAADEYRGEGQLQLIVCHAETVPAEEAPA